MGKDLNGHFTKVDIWMDNMHMKWFSTLLVIREMQIKTIVTYYFTPIRLAIIENTNNNKCCRRWGETGTPIDCWWEHKMVQPLWKTVWQFLKIAQQFLWISITALLVIGKKCKQLNVYPLMNEVWYVHIMEYEVHAIIWMNLKNVKLSKRRQTQETTYYGIPFK